MCFVDRGKTLDKVPWTVFEWTMRKKGIPEFFVGPEMSLYEEEKTRVRVDSESSEEFEVKVRMHH